MIAIITNSKFFFTTGMFPKKNPSAETTSTHSIPPIALNEIKCLYCIFPIPATNGAKVRTIGINLAKIIVFPPCFS